MRRLYTSTGTRETQWCSALMGSNDFPTEDTPATEFRSRDHFYLRMWCRDLKYHFPFLDETAAIPTSHFYCLWKLSYLYGRELRGLLCSI